MSERKYNPILVKRNAYILGYILEFSLFWLIGKILYGNVLFSNSLWVTMMLVQGIIIVIGFSLLLVAKRAIWHYLISTIMGLPIIVGILVIASKYLFISPGISQKTILFFGILFFSIIVWLNYFVRFNQLNDSKEDNIENGRYDEKKGELDLSKRLLFKPLSETNREIKLAKILGNLSPIVIAVGMAISRRVTTDSVPVITGSILLILFFTAAAFPGENIAIARHLHGWEMEIGKSIILKGSRQTDI